MEHQLSDNIWAPVHGITGYIEGEPVRGITGYIEMFKHSSGELMTIPGSSRWIEGPELDLSKAKVIDEDE